jgi:hypothetical protein
MRATHKMTCVLHGMVWWLCDTADGTLFSKIDGEENWQGCTHNLGDYKNHRDFVVVGLKAFKGNK